MIKRKRFKWQLFQIKVVTSYDITEQTLLACSDMHFRGLFLLTSCRKDRAIISNSFTNPTQSCRKNNLLKFAMKCFLENAMGLGCASKLLLMINDIQNGNYLQLYVFHSMIVLLHKKDFVWEHKTA